MLTPVEITECPHDVPGLITLRESPEPWTDEVYEHLRDCVRVGSAFGGGWMCVKVDTPLVSVRYVVVAKAHLPGVDVEDILAALRARAREDGQ